MKTGRRRVLIAGIGGASLGTELLKCLRLAGGYEVYGCDISSRAYGLYESGFAETFRVNRDDYIADVFQNCQRLGIHWVIPGGEQPMVLLGPEIDALKRMNIGLLGNSRQVIQTFSNKDETFRTLREQGIETPRTVAIQVAEDLEKVGLPCIVKPSTGSGGSASVFYAVTKDEALVYSEFIRNSGQVPLAQEYIGDEEGEYTVGVISMPNGKILGSIALRRALDAKLSVAYRARGGLISSGYSQGLIQDFPEIRIQAETIARAVGSQGPLNVQGRIRNGKLLPFEINPRFSASTYLRALAGFNEVDILIRALEGEPLSGPFTIRPGWYLRTLTEKFVAVEELK